MIILGILVDTLQPPHVGIKQAYDYICKVRNHQYAYIIATDKKHKVQSELTEPLSLADKEQILIKHGIPRDKIIEGKSAFDTSQLETRFDPDDTAVIFYFFSDRPHVGYSNERIIPWNEAYANDPKYLSEVQPMNHSVYYEILQPSIKRVKGINLNTSLFIDEIGDPNNSEDNKKTFFALAFGWYDAGLYNMLKERLRRPYEMMVSRYSKAAAQPTLEQSIQEISKVMIEDLKSMLADTPEEDQSASDKLAAKQADVQKLRLKQKTLDLTKKQTDSETKAGKEKVRQLTNDYNKSKRDLASGNPVSGQVSQYKN